MSGIQMSSNDYLTRLRKALAEAEATNAQITQNWMASDAHPMSNDYQSEKTSVMLSAGQVIGLQTALNLLTGEDQQANVTLPAARSGSTA
jgi:hypothetical protein